ncbi:MAG: hypothetical protein J7524_23430, partial [Roseofilum sp. Belize BBD 4]|uniref:hypothetical protein n=1 Tax=Roseofilum sp. Belize BBD 4 TaxID=2821500 RepID=UPI001B27501A
MPYQTAPTPSGYTPSQSSYRPSNWWGYSNNRAPGKTPSSGYSSWTGWSGGTSYGGTDWGWSSGSSNVEPRTPPRASIPKKPSAPSPRWTAPGLHGSRSPTRRRNIYGDSYRQAVQQQEINRRIRKEALEELSRQSRVAEAYDHAQDVYDAFKNSPEWQNELAKIQRELDKIDELEDLAKGAKVPKPGSANPTRLGGIKLPAIADDVTKTVSNLIEQIAKTPTGKTLLKGAGLLGQLGRGLEFLTQVILLKEGLENLFDPNRFGSLPYTAKLWEEAIQDLLGIDPNQIPDSVLQDATGIQTPNQAAIEQWLQGFQATPEGGGSPDYNYQQPASPPSPELYPGASIPPISPGQQLEGVDEAVLRTIGGEAGFVFYRGGGTAWIGRGDPVDYWVKIEGPYWGSDKTVSLEMLEVTFFANGGGHVWLPSSGGTMTLEKIFDPPQISVSTLKDWVAERVHNGWRYIYPNRTRSKPKYLDELAKARESLKNPGRPQFNQVRIKQRIKETGEIEVITGTFSNFRSRGIPVPPVESATMIQTYPPVLLAKPPVERLPIPLPKPKVKKEEEMRCCTDPLTADNNRMLKMLMKATAADKFATGIQVPSSPFLDDGDPDLVGLIGNIPQIKYS